MLVVRAVMGVCFTPLHTRPDGARSCVLCSSSSSSSNNAKRHEAFTTHATEVAVVALPTTHMVSTTRLPSQRARRLSHPSGNHPPRFGTLSWF
eukprot:386275-Prymnesium_polylepis.1